ncbi:MULTISPECIES: transposase [Nonomuraea]|uniref:Transposase n=1 Tax=Nonomuraea mangrovi TaxID=2316207 RepID=A0ABW4T955_9ACTN
MFELTDAVLSADGPVKTLVGPALAPEASARHGALYDGLDHGRIDMARLRMPLATSPLPRAADGRPALAVSGCMTGICRFIVADAGYDLRWLPSCWLSCPSGCWAGCAPIG